MPCVYPRVVMRGGTWSLAGDQAIRNHIVEHQTVAIWTWNATSQAWDSISQMVTFEVSRIGQKIFLRMANVVDAPLIHVLTERMFKPVQAGGGKAGTLYQYFPVVKKRVGRDKPVISS